MARADEDEDEVDLGISLVTLGRVVEMARAVQVTEETDPDSLADEDAEERVPPEDADEITETSVAEFIDGLNTDEQAALIALAWIGRGDYEAEDWEEALELAAERNEEGDAGEYLLGMDLVGDLIAEGVAAFGLSIEEV
jgi:Protein of unknown function (DUF3775)